MDPDAVKRSLEMEDKAKAAFISKLPDHFYDQFLLHGLRIDAVEIGRILFSLSVTPSLCSSSGGFIHGGFIASMADVLGSAILSSAGLHTTGVSLEIGLSFVDVAFAGDELEIEAKLLRAGKSVGVISIDFVNKRTGKIIAQKKTGLYLSDTDHHRGMVTTNQVSSSLKKRKGVLWSPQSSSKFRLSLTNGDVVSIMTESCFVFMPNLTSD